MNYEYIGATRTATGSGLPSTESLNEQIKALAEKLIREAKFSESFDDELVDAIIHIQIGLIMEEVVNTIDPTLTVKYSVYLSEKDDIVEVTIEDVYRSVSSF